MNDIKQMNDYISKCIRNNIKVYPVVYDINYMKIEVDYSGRKKTGDEKFNWRTEQKKLQNKIKEIYETIGSRI